MEQTAFHTGAVTSIENADPGAGLELVDPNPERMVWNMDREGPLTETITDAAAEHGYRVVQRVGGRLVLKPID